ncbi:MAG: AAA family ATPase [Myxococcota bacterium]
MTYTARFEQISARSYKAFAEDELLPLRPLTVVFGANGSGKSALCRLPVALGAALRVDAGAAAALPLEVGDLSFGSSFFDLRHGDGTRDFTVGLRVRRPSGEITTLLATIGQDPQSRSSHPRQWVERWTLSTTNDSTVDLRWSSSDKKYKKNDSGLVDVSFSGLLPRDSSGASIPEAHPLRDIPPIVRLAPTRDGTSGELGEHRPEPGLHVGSDGSQTLDILGTLKAEREDEALNAIISDVRDVLGVELLVDELAVGTLTRFAVRGRRQGREHLVPVDQLGTGLAHALPIITQHALASSSQAVITLPGLLISEEPEAHLHPEAQAYLADVVIRAAQSERTQCLVETHSETFVLRIRRRVAEGSLDPSQVAFVWVDDDGPSTRTQYLEIKADGSIPDWPENWFDAPTDEVRAIHRARSSR